MHLLSILGALLLVGVDRLTKWLVVSHMKISDTVNLIKIGDKEVLNFYYTLNNGAAFSKLEGKTVFLIVITSLVILALLALVILKKVRRPVYLVSIALILGGGIGNLIDRIFNDGKVVDFIDFRLINFPIFNFADICAVCGAGLLVIVVMIDEIREHKNKKSAEEAGGESFGDSEIGTAELSEETSKPVGEQVSDD